MDPSPRPCYVPHEPVGSRCWATPLLNDSSIRLDWDLSVEAAHREIDDLHHNRLDPMLTPAEHAEYAGQLMILMHKAKHGNIAFNGRDAEGNVVGGTVVELKPRLRQTRPAFGRRPRLLRLYLGEPALYPRTLLALLLATKEDSEAGLVEQDADIAEAKQRAEAWCRGPELPVGLLIGDEGGD